MIKAMLFIDGSWLYANLPELGKIYGKPDFQIDFGKLPTVLAEDIAEQAGIGAIDLVRTYYFASYAENYDLRDIAAVQRRMSFFSRLKEDYNYEVEAFPINYQGRRLRRADRDPGDDFVPKEKCVDISLAITAMHYATMPGAMDVAILLIGDRDFVPLLQDIRRRGIRVAVASIYGSCAQELADPADAARVRDFDVVWLNDLLDRVEYVVAEEQPMAPDAPQPPEHHHGAGAAGHAAGRTRRVWTTNVPRWDRRPQWLATRDAMLRAAAATEAGYGPADAEWAHQYHGCGVAAAGVGQVLRGRMKNIIWDRGFGFIAADDGPDYFFHANALEEGLSFDELQPNMEVVFEVKTPPTPMRAGAALCVRRVDSAAAEGGEEASGDDEPAATEAAAANAGTPAGGEDEAAPAVDNGDAAPPTARAVAAAVAGHVLRGWIKNVIWDRGFGFIATEEGPDYFFHANGLTGDLRFELLQPGMAVLFEIRARPTAVRAGAALNVRRCDGVEAAAPAGGAGDEPAADGEPGPDGGAAAEPGPAPGAAENPDFSTASAVPGGPERA